MREAQQAWAAVDEFAGIFQHADGVPEKRPVMSHPPRMIASASFVREVTQMLEDFEQDPAQVADWIADKMERFGAFMAEPMLDLEGNGPTCSWCKTIWPMCGHHHQSQRIKELEATEGSEEAR